MHTIAQLLPNQGRVAQESDVVFDALDVAGLVLFIEGERERNNLPVGYCAKVGVVDGGVIGKSFLERGADSVIGENGGATICV